MIHADPQYCAGLFNTPEQLLEFDEMATPKYSAADFSTALAEVRTMRKNHSELMAIKLIIEQDSEKFAVQFSTIEFSTQLKCSYREELFEFAGDKFIKGILDDFLNSDEKSLQKLADCLSGINKNVIADTIEGLVRNKEVKMPLSTVDEILKVLYVPKFISNRIIERLKGLTTKSAANTDFLHQPVLQPSSDKSHSQDPKPEVPNMSHG